MTLDELFKAVEDDGGMEYVVRLQGRFAELLQ